MADRNDSFGHELARRLVDTLPHGQTHLFNPWKDRCAMDLPGNGPEEKLRRLGAHLSVGSPEFILCGEAPGYQGCRHSGIAFTSERLILAGEIPRVQAEHGVLRFTHRPLAFSEPSATIVWKALRAFGLEEKTVLWNALQLHPHRPGETHSNRTPTPAELALGEPALRALVEAFPGARLVAIGKKAESLMANMGLNPVACVRHPANGGATAFTSGLKTLMA